MLTHLTPPLDAGRQGQGPNPIPGVALTTTADGLGGYEGTPIVRTDLVSLTLRRE